MIGNLPPPIIEKYEKNSKYNLIIDNEKIQMLIFAANIAKDNVSNAADKIDISQPSNIKNIAIQNAETKLQIAYNAVKIAYNILYKLYLIPEPSQPSQPSQSDLLAKSQEEERQRVLAAAAAAAQKTQDEELQRVLAATAAAAEQQRIQEEERQRVLAAAAAAAEQQRQSPPPPPPPELPSSIQNNVVNVVNVEPTGIIDSSIIYGNIDDKKYYYETNDKISQELKQTLLSFLESAK